MCLYNSSAGCKTLNVATTVNGFVQAELFALHLLPHSILTARLRGGVTIIPV